MKILVTGGSGFIGRTVVSDLLAHNFAVRVLDKTREGLTEIKDPSLELIQGGIEDPEKVQEAVTGVEVIFHLAETFSANPYEVLDIDIRGNLNLLKAATEHGVKHFLFASTHRVYGRPRYLPIDEEHPLHPEESGRALYATAKLANEKLCLIYFQEHNLPVTIFRFWWSFAHKIGGKVLRSMIDTALRGEPIIVPEQAGGNFLHNDDAALAFRKATLNSLAYGETFNISSGTFTSWVELAELVLEVTDSSSRLELIPKGERGEEPIMGTDHSIYYECNLDISKAERLMGYKPRYDPQDIKGLLREAIKDLVLTRKKGMSKNTRSNPKK